MTRYLVGLLHRLTRSRRSLRVMGVFLSTAVVLTLVAPPVDAESGVEQIDGSGSSWAYNAINTWIYDVTQQGLQVVFTPSGSAQGRQDFANGVSDFGVSDIGYQGVNPVTGENDTSNRPYAYLPIVGGATTFPYNLVVAGHQVENLRLSGLTLARIFTDQITNWDDPEITADNNGHAFPSIPIIPVVHSEGAGSTYQFTDYLNSLYPQLWQPFSGYKFPVEFWPTGKGSQVAENGSSGVIDFVSSGAGQGSIGFDEYSYPLGSQCGPASCPVVALENADGYYTMPDAYDAAVALTQADIDYTPGPDYLLETLNHVWTYNDPRTYPLSSYSYEIEPTASCSGQPPCDPTMNTPKRQALADFDAYSLCQGQSQMAPIGYSPLPINLVEASFKQVDLLQHADPQVSVANVNVANCDNPTFIPGDPDKNELALIAPYPPACAKAGQGPCPGQYAHNGNPVAGQATNTGPSTTSPTGNSSGGQTNGGSSSSATGGGGSSSGGTSSSGGGSSPAGVSSTGSEGGAAAAGGGAGTHLVAAGSTGGSQTAAGGGSSAGGSSSTVTTVTPEATPTVLAADHPGSIGGLLIEVLAALLIVGALTGPAWGRSLRNRVGRR